MNTINKLAEYFSQFPGIGPRQSKRFVYFLLTRDHTFLEELAQLLLELKKEVSICTSCHRFFAGNSSALERCDICSSQSRDTKMLMVVEKDIDLENIEQSRVYGGLYFILGGTVAILEKKPEQKVRAQKLLKTVEERVAKNGLKEVILAFSVNPEGENTTRYIAELLSPLVLKHSLKVSTLGRGLSTGTELEYPDAETIKSAFKNRT